MGGLEWTVRGQKLCACCSPWRIASGRRRGWPGPPGVGHVSDPGGVRGPETCNDQSPWPSFAVVAACRLLQIKRKIEDRAHGPGRAWATLIDTQCGTHRSPRSSSTGGPVWATPKRVAAPSTRAPLPWASRTASACHPCVARPATAGPHPWKVRHAADADAQSRTAAARHAGRGGLGARRFAGLNRDSPIRRPPMAEEIWITGD